MLRVLGTGVLCDTTEEPGAVCQMELFAEVQTQEGEERIAGYTHWCYEPIESDPTSLLLGEAYAFRDQNLGNLLGDLRISGEDVTRWEFYSAPFRVELSEELRAELRGRWKDRDPWSCP